MFKPNTLVFIRRSGLIVAGKRISPTRLTFGAKQVNNLEILDNTGLSEQCQAFFSDQGFRHKRVLVVLDHDIIFEKTLAADEMGNRAEILDQFIAAMPFEAGKRAYVTVTTRGDVRLYATNYELYSIITAALEATGVSKITAVTPVNLYGLEPGRPLNDIVAKLLKDATIRKQADFADCEPV